MIDYDDFAKVDIRAGTIRAAEVLVLGMNDADGAVVLVRPQYPVPDGTRLY